MNVHITLSGADDSVDVAQLLQLLERVPELELGLLYTQTPEGRRRYPPLEWIEQVAATAPGRCAIHVCGSRARAAFYQGELGHILQHVGRIQINGAVTAEEIEKACGAHTDHVIITQHNAHNREVLGVPCANHALLVDASGGRSLSPLAWTRPITSKWVGFAGGLGPLNLTEELPRIAQAAAPFPLWIDMEGSLRVDDLFSVTRARQVLELWEGRRRLVG